MWPKAQPGAPIGAQCDRAPRETGLRTGPRVPCLPVVGCSEGVSVMDPNYQEWGRHPQRREARPPGEQWGWGPIVECPA